MGIDRKSAHWKQALRSGLSTAADLSRFMAVDEHTVRRVTDVYPMRINAYFADLMKKKGPSLIRQVVPDGRELHDPQGMDDPLGEEHHSPVPYLTHRYPDRVLFLVSAECPVYCRFCTRKRKIGKMQPIGTRAIREGIHYIRTHRRIRDVLLSGGDPLLLSDDRLAWILSSIRAIPHVEIIRIGSRVPGVLPQRVTAGLCRILKKFHPLFLNLHFNHPDEITDEVRRACGRLADAGIPLGSQTVLLRGINDNPPVIRALMKQMLRMRVRPYYLLQGDLSRGTGHFRTPLSTGLGIVQALRGHVSGLAVPTLVVDLPGGGGKVPLAGDYRVRTRNGKVVFRNYRGIEYTYPESVVA
jgi:lysine 2,3-aminomutase